MVSKYPAGKFTHCRWIFGGPIADDISSQSPVLGLARWSRRVVPSVLDWNIRHKIQRWLGRDRIPFLNRQRPHHLRKLGLCDDKEGPDFAIDGAGGEYITFVYGKFSPMSYLSVLVVCQKQVLRVLIKADIRG